MTTTRRAFLGRAATASLGAVGLAASAPVLADDSGPLPIIDTHQHLWEMGRLWPPWLESASAVLKRRYTTAEYLEATEGLHVVQAVYMEIDLPPARHVEEAEALIALCRGGTTTTRAAVIGGRLASVDFADYLARFRQAPEVKGVRRVLHSSETPPGFCLRPEFERGVRALGEAGLRFDLCLRPGELDDGVKLVDHCPGTRFILDHCGNADPLAFRKPADGSRPSHDPDAWKRSIDALARRSNVVCKISGVYARTTEKEAAEVLAPVVNHCLDHFGPDRVVFGGDWPVCLLGGSYRGWVEALRQIVSNRPRVDQRKLWHDNAITHYGLHV